MIKKIFATVVVIAMMSVSAVYAAEPQKAVTVKNAFTVKVNGEYIKNDTHYVDGIVYVPLRAVFETMGASVTWEAETNTVRIDTGIAPSDTYKAPYQIAETLEYSEEYIYPGSASIIVDAVPVSGESFILNGTTYISVSALNSVIAHSYVDSNTYSIRAYSENYKPVSEDAFVHYGDNKTLKYSEFTDLAKLFYGSVETAAANNFSEVDSYLLIKEAVADATKEINISYKKEELEDFLSKNKIYETIETAKIENSDFICNDVMVDFLLREKLTTTDPSEIYSPKSSDLKAFYETMSESKGLWLKAQHILISKDEAGEGLKKAEELLKKARKKGTDFTKLMLENSEDPGSKSLPEGYVFTEGQMVTEFYDGTLNLKVGEISEIVESTYGYHIIKKIAHWEDGIPYEEIEKEVKTNYNNKVFSEKLNNHIIDGNVYYKNSEIK